MSAGHKTTQSVDPQTRSLGLGILGQAQDYAKTPFTPFDPNSIAQYQNPYTDSVINAGTADLNRGREMSILGNHQDLTLANAFGGSRTGVADSLSNDAFYKDLANFTALQRSAGFNNANQTAQFNYTNQQNDPRAKLGILGSTFGTSVLPTATQTSQQSGSLLMGILQAALSGVGSLAWAGAFGGNPGPGPGAWVAGAGG